MQLDDKPVQHREVMDHESELFKDYFDEITLLEGGCVASIMYMYELHSSEYNIY